MVHQSSRQATIRGSGRQRQSQRQLGEPSRAVPEQYSLMQRRQEPAIQGGAVAELGGESPGQLSHMSQDSCDLQASIQFPISVPHSASNQRDGYEVSVSDKIREPNLKANARFLPEIPATDLWMEIIKLRGILSDKDKTIRELRADNQSLRAQLYPQNQLVQYPKNHRKPQCGLHMSQKQLNSVKALQLKPHTDTIGIEEESKSEVVSQDEAFKYQDEVVNDTPSIPQNRPKNQKPKKFHYSIAQSANLSDINESPQLHIPVSHFNIVAAASSQQPRVEPPPQQQDIQSPSQAKDQQHAQLPFQMNIRQQIPHSDGQVAQSVPSEQQVDLQLINQVNRMQVNMSRFQKQQLAQACKMNNQKNQLPDELESDSMEFGENGSLQFMDIKRDIISQSARGVHSQVELSMEQRILMSQSVSQNRRRLSGSLQRASQPSVEALINPINQAAVHPVVPVVNQPRVAQPVHVDSVRLSSSLSERERDRNAHYFEHLNYQSMYFDEGADEFEVAEERAHLFGENVNAEILTYEQLLELQERIGFVNRGMKVGEMNKFPQMLRKDLRKYIKKKVQEVLIKPADGSPKKPAIRRGSSSQNDLENAAPEEHHPREENLQRVLIQVPMPGFVRPRQNNQEPVVPQNSQQELVLSYDLAIDQAQDELLPGEERKMPPQLNIFSYRNAGRRINSSELIEDIQLSEEGQAIHRLPSHQKEPHESHPGARSNPMSFSMDMDERQNIAIVRSIIGQQRLRQRNQISDAVAAVSEDIDEEDGGYSANLHDEHLQEARGIQAPKFNYTKHNKIDSLGPRQHKFASASQSRSSCMSEAEHSRELCIICYDQIEMEDVIKLIEPCNHYFHMNCINQWLLVEKKCPMCMVNL